MKELMLQSQVVWDDFNVFGIFAPFCRFTDAFLDSFVKFSELYTDLSFYTVDILNHQEFISLYKLTGTPSLVFIYTPQNYLSVHTGNYEPVQMCALLNLSLSRLGETA